MRHLRFPPASSLHALMHMNVARPYVSNLSTLARRCNLTVTAPLQRSRSHLLASADSRYYYRSFSQSSISSPAVTSFTLVPEGEEKTINYRLFYRPTTSSEAAKYISPWHHIPICPSSTDSTQLYNYINEIPLNTVEKFECSKSDPHNPLRQDIKKGKLRNFTYGKIPFNYGYIPQTWEDPHHKHPLTGRVGDNDPIDVVELSELPLEFGALKAIKVIGVFALIDEGETDWKLIAIDSSNPKFRDINTLQEYQQKFGNDRLNIIHDWFLNYKTTDGKPQNEFAFKGDILPAPYAHLIIEETHQSWKDLIEGKASKDGIWLP